MNIEQGLAVQIRPDMETDEEGTAMGERPAPNRASMRQKLAIGLVVGDFAALLVGFGLAAYFRPGGDVGSAVRDFLFVLTPLFFVFSVYNNAHHPELSENYLASIRRGLSSLAMAAIALALIMFFFKVSANYSRFVFGLGCVLAAAIICATRFFVVRQRQAMGQQSLYAVLSVFDGVRQNKAAGLSGVNARAMGIVPDLTDAAAIGRLGRLVEGMDRIIVHCAPERRQDWAAALKALDVPSEIVMPELADLGALSLRTDENGRTALVLNSGHLSWNQRVAKRTFDLLLSLALLALTAPILIVTAIAIKIDSPGPIFFRQDRIGLGNRVFRIWKFRSMRTETSDLDGAVSTAREDRRVTRIGGFLRRTSIDELPQLLNVVGGSMSLVGPRPHASGSRAEEMLFWDIDHRYWYRHTVKPGLTGLAQIRGFRGSTLVKSDLTNRLQADLEYVINWSLLGDVRILLRTATVLVHRNAF